MKRLLFLLLLVGCNDKGSVAANVEKPGPGTIAGKNLFVFGDDFSVNNNGFIGTIASQYGMTIRNNSKPYDGSNGCFLGSFTQFNQISYRQSMVPGDVAIFFAGMCNAMWYGDNPIPADEMFGRFNTFLDVLKSKGLIIYVATVPKIPIYGYNLPPPMGMGSEAVVDYYSQRIRDLAQARGDFQVIDVNQTQVNPNHFDVDGRTLTQDGNDAVASEFLKVVGQ